VPEGYTEAEWTAIQQEDARVFNMPIIEMLLTKGKITT